MAIRVEMQRDKSGRNVVTAIDETGVHRTTYDVEEPDWPEIVERSLIARSAKTFIADLDKINEPPHIKKRKEARP